MNSSLKHPVLKGKDSEQMQKKLKMDKMDISVPLEERPL